VRGRRAEGCKYGTPRPEPPDDAREQSWQLGAGDVREGVERDDRIERPRFEFRCRDVAMDELSVGNRDLRTFDLRLRDVDPDKPSASGEGRSRFDPAAAADLEDVRMLWTRERSFCTYCSRGSPTI
jgi:hypothetical protein